MAGIKTMLEFSPGAKALKGLFSDDDDDEDEDDELTKPKRPRRPARAQKPRPETML